MQKSKIERCINQVRTTEAGAIFNPDASHRFMLWRIWDRKLPLAMFVGLNPSTANETDSDPTIRSVGRICRANGFGGFLMLNRYSQVSTDPKKLNPKSLHAFDDGLFLEEAATLCSEVVFAWGAFKVAKEAKELDWFAETFPNAKCLAHNADGTPKHPLYCKSSTPLIPFYNATQQD